MLDATTGDQRVTTLADSRTPVLLGEIIDLIGARAELRDPRVPALVDYDAAARVVDAEPASRNTCAISATSAGRPRSCRSTRTHCATGSGGPRSSSTSI